VCPAGALFENPEVHEAAAANLMAVGRHGFLAAEDWSTVKAAVVAGFRRIDDELSKKAPEASRRLGLIQLSEEQKDAVLSSMRLLSERRVQNIGFEVGQAIRESRSTDREVLRRRIEARLQPRLPELLRLREELMPEPLRELWATDHHWDMTLDPENVQVMQAKQGGKFADAFSSIGDVYRMGAASKPIAFSSESYSVMGGVVEEARALIDLIKVCTRLFGKELEVPANATSLVGTFNFGAEALSCELRTAGSDDRTNLLKALFCPLKFGTQGVDALRAAVDMDSRLQAQV
jgi:hypothetical protein